MHDRSQYNICNVDYDDEYDDDVHSLFVNVSANKFVLYRYTVRYHESFEAKLETDDDVTTIHTHSLDASVMVTEWD